MTSIQTVLLILLVVAALGVLLWRWYKSHIFEGASGLVRQVLPVWAAQGPFESGYESAAAMRSASLAVLGPEETERTGMAKALAKHAAVYDSSPTEWERIRQEATRLAGPKTEKFVTISKGLAAMDSLNKDFLADSGHKFEFARQPDGTLGLSYKKLWSEEAIDEKRKQDNEALVSGIGNALLNDSSEEACALVAFLADLYRASRGDEAVSASAIGRAWLACSTVEVANGELESELAQEFSRLNEAHQATIRISTDITLEWSSNPGAHEAHLIRRQNNPYFPEPRRIVSKEELAEAKRMDDDDYMLCQQRFGELGKEIEALPSTFPVAEFHKIRERLDDVILFSMGVGGPAKEIATKADQLRDAVILDMRAAFSGDVHRDKASSPHKLTMLISRRENVACNPRLQSPHWWWRMEARQEDAAHRISINQEQLIYPRRHVGLVCVRIGGCGRAIQTSDSFRGEQGTISGLAGA